MSQTKSDLAALEQGYYLDEAEPLKVKKFIETHCRLPADANGYKTGDRVQLIPWTWNQLILPFYGWRRPDGSQRFHNGACFTMKKQSKTFILSCLALYECLKQPGAEVYLISSRTETASHIFKFARKIIEQSPELSKRFHIQPHTKIITDRARPKGQWSFIKVMSSDDGNAQGQNASAVFYDEIGIIKDRAVWDGFQHSVAGRDGVQFSISTPQADRETVGWTEYLYAKQILEGTRTDISFLPIIHGVPEDVDYRNPENWWEHIPSLDITVPKRYFLEKWEKVKDDPRECASFRTLMLGQWVESLDCWISDTLWDSCYEDFQEKDLHGLQAIIGIDPGENNLQSYCLLVEKDGKIYLLPRFAIPEETAKKEIEKKLTPYWQWASDSKNNLKITDGDRNDPRSLRTRIQDDAKNFTIKGIGYDANFEESRLLLVDAGYDPVKVNGTYNVVSEATQQFKQMLTDKRIVHNGNPILRWNALNASVKADRDDRIIIWRDNCRGRYDGISAAITGLKLWLDRPRYQWTDILLVPA